MKIEIKLIPDGLDLAKEIQDGIPVDQMVNGGGDDGSCPVATQDVETNEENQRLAIKEHQYGPAINPESSCGVCAYYNISPQMQSCMQDDSGETGYCQLLKFVCAASNSCSSFEVGGPITEIM
jgi:hypothetical protein